MGGNILIKTLDMKLEEDWFSLDEKEVGMDLVRLQGSKYEESKEVVSKNCSVWGLLTSYGKFIEIDLSNSD